MRNRTNKPSARDVDLHVPVRPPAFAVLAALADGARPGIQILDQVNATVRRPMMFGPGTLYRLLRDMRAEGLIVRIVPEDDGGPRDERRAHHALTPLGAAVLASEAERLRRTLKLAGALPRPSR